MSTLLNNPYALHAVSTRKEETAWSDNHMKTIKTDRILKDLKGEDLKEPSDAGPITVTVGKVMAFVLGGRVSNPTLGWVLGKKFATEKEVDLKAEDIVFLKKELEDNAKSERGLSALYVGQLIEMLEEKEEEKKK